MMNDSLASSTFDIFRSFIRILCQLNEISSCLNPWIITQSHSGDVAIAALDMNPVYSTVGYAVLEPLFVRQLQGLAAPTWSLLIGTSSWHIVWSLNAMISYTGLLGIVRSIESDLSNRSIDLPTFMKQRRRITRLFQFFTLVNFVLPMMSASLVNACLLIFSESLHVESLLRQPRILLVVPTAMIVFLTCRFADYEICRKAGRGRPSYEAIMLQLCLCAIRFCVRAAVGLLPLMPFQEIDHIERERLYGSERYQWTNEGRSGILFTTSWVLALCGLPLMIAGYHLMLQPRLAEKNRMERDLVDSAMHKAHE
jgi:hypothetical protein